jgi:type IV secretion system protein VirB6
MVVQGIESLSGLLGRGLWSWLQPKASMIDDFGDFVFFKFVLDRLEHDVAELGESIVGRMMTFVGMLAVSLLTIWILIQGYRMVTGQLRESAVALVTNTAKSVMIVAVAISFSLFDRPLTDFLTDDVQGAIYYLVTGNEGKPADEIDSNLGWMQVAMSSLDVLESGGDMDARDQKDRASMMIGLGTGGPAIVAGALLLMYQVAMALFIGFGPLFILCLLFDFTKGLFQKWLFYGIGTMFSLAVLAAMSSIALKMVTDVAVAMWGSDVLTSLVLGGGDVVSYNSRAMQTGGMGMILTLLLISVPPMAASFFSGTLGQFNYSSAFMGMRGGGAGVGPGGQPPGSPGYIPPQPGTGGGRHSGGAHTGQGSGGFNQMSTTNTYATGGAMTNSTPVADAAKQSPSRGAYTGGGATGTADVPLSGGNTRSGAVNTGGANSSSTTQPDVVKQPPKTS